MIQAFDGSRIETRFEGTTQPWSTLPPGVEEISYPANVNNSAYFATTSDLSHISKGQGVLRLRFRTSEIEPAKEAVQVLNPAQSASLEIKLHRSRDELRAEAHTNVIKRTLGTMGIGTAIKQLSSPERHTWMQAFVRGDPELADTDVLNWLFDDEPLSLLNISQMRRRHFRIHLPRLSARVTYDSDISFWVACESQPDPTGVLYAVRSATMNKSVVEIKSDRDAGRLDEEATNQVLTSIFGTDHDYVSSVRPKSSTAMAATRNLGQPRLANPDVRTARPPKGDYSAVPVQLIEREQKFLTSADARFALPSLKELSDSPFHISPPRPSTIYFRMFRLGGITVREVSPNPNFQPAAYRFKDSLHQEGDNVIVRNKHKLPDFTTLCQQLKVSASRDQVTGETPIAKRERVTVSVVLKDTGNQFDIIADHCTHANTDRELNQVEIEYQGRFGFPHGEQIDRSTIDRDFARVKQAAAQALRVHNLTLTSTSLTKQDWLSN